MFKLGDVVFFKQAGNGSHRKSKGCQFKGHGFGMFLGHVPPFAKDPSPQQLLMMVGRCGFLTFDDVADFLGDEAAKTCVDKYETKYYGNQPPSVKDEQGLIIGIDGNPIVPENGVLPVLTLADVQKKLKDMKPEEIREAIKNARNNAAGMLTPEQEAEIGRQTCEKLGVDPSILDEPTKEDADVKALFPKSNFPKGDDE